jgi:Protein of unknown function (DUF3800)
MNYSDYIVYIDESGDHGLTNINADHPVFALAFCVVEKTKYMDAIVPAFQKLKFEFWGHDSVVLHGHEIRKAQGDFNILLNAKTREKFMARMSELIADADFTLIAAVIDKEKHVAKYSDPVDPYGIALGFCMERLQRFLIEKKQADRLTHLQVECRGRTRTRSSSWSLGESATERTPSVKCRTWTSASWTRSTIRPDFSWPTLWHIPSASTSSIRRRPTAPMMCWNRNSGETPRATSWATVSKSSLKSEGPRYSPRPGADRAFPIH